MSYKAVLSINSAMETVRPRTLGSRGPSRQNGSKCRIFYWRKVIFRVWLITYEKIMSLQARELHKNRAYACTIGIHRLTLSKL